ncbi:hypothetical protein AFK68_28470 [Hydrocoleum sp. CS-953]|nr:hypothetical protein AFK68_28470 [Hydrocoleum sp. CS-953]
MFAEHSAGKHVASRRERRPALSELLRFICCEAKRHPILRNAPKTTAFFSMNGEALYLNFSVKNFGSSDTESVLDRKFYDEGKAVILDSEGRRVRKYKVFGKSTFTNG